MSNFKSDLDSVLTYELTDEKALRILNLKGKSVNEYTFKQLKNQFRIMALNYHPDKQNLSFSNDGKSSKESNEKISQEYHNKFIKIKDAFDYLIARLEKTTNGTVYGIEENKEKDLNQTEFTFYDLFILLIRFVKRSFKDEEKLKILLLDWIKIYNIKLKTLLEIKRFIDLNETYLFVTPSLIKVLDDVIKNIRKEKKIRYYEIHPTIDDIMNGNFYILEENIEFKIDDSIHETKNSKNDIQENQINQCKEVQKTKNKINKKIKGLKMEDETENEDNVDVKNKNNKFYIPLWHHQLFFGDNYDIEVSIIPDIQHNIFIDEENNLYLKLVYGIQDVLKNKGIEFKIGNFNFFIEGERIKCVKQQSITIKNKGIYKIDKNYLKPAIRNDIIVLLELV